MYFPHSEDKEKDTHFALIGGKVVPYDGCSERRDAPYAPSFEYIGKGYIHSIKGKVFDNWGPFHFWKKRKGI